MEKTKLIATVCTNKNAKGQIDKFIEYGIDVIRINMSYTTRDSSVIKNEFYKITDNRAIFVNKVSNLNIYLFDFY